MRHVALTIAGSDCSGGAGIQADIKTMLANGVYAMSVITALTAQNTTGVYSIMNVKEDFLKSQLELVFEDIFPDSIKIGMVSDSKLIKVIDEILTKYNPKNVVIDPVMVSTSGSKLISDDALDALKQLILDKADLITPNIFEAEILSGQKIKNADDMEKTALIINNKFNSSVLLKGGHSINDANDVLCIDGKIKWFYSNRIDNDNTHGTGCTLSSAIASYLARGFNMYESIQKAKEYLTECLKANLNLGKASGPLDHGYFIK